MKVRMQKRAGAAAAVATMVLVLSAQPAIAKPAGKEMRQQEDAAVSRADTSNLQRFRQIVRLGRSLVTRIHEIVTIPPGSPNG
ncbi:MAG TPA: hypothetical protein VGF69_23405 [Thermoanaerobaculia bacterium]|jgi:hypothetical protein